MIFCLFVTFFKCNLSVICLGRKIFNTILEFFLKGPLMPSAGARRKGSDNVYSNSILMQTCLDFAVVYYQPLSDFPVQTRSHMCVRVCVTMIALSTCMPWATPIYHSTLRAHHSEHCPDRHYASQQIIHSKLLAQKENKPHRVGCCMLCHGAKCWQEKTVIRYLVT